MRSGHRSLTKCVRAVLSLSVFLSLVGCLPTSPMLGNPEKSRIDPDLNGLWVDAEEPGVVLFEPFDKRTWLMTYAGFDFNDEACGVEDVVDEPDELIDIEPQVPADADLAAEVIIEIVDVESDDYRELLELIAAHGIECFDASGETLVLKAWRTQIGKQAFMTWEPKGTFDEEYGFAPTEWLNFRVDKPDADTLSLEMVNFGHEGFEGIEALEKLGEEEPPYSPRTLKAATRAAERVIRKNIDDDELFEEAFEFHRVPADNVDFFAAILDEVWDW